MKEQSYNIYVPHSSSDEGWGLYVLDIGKVSTPANMEYPQGTHPADYILNFDKGRILSEFQLIYITEGAGEFESETAGKRQVMPGTIIIVYPDEWHRYRPIKSTGWRESWVGFDGTIARQVMSSAFFRKEDPVVRIGIHSRINAIYDQIYFDCLQEGPGYQQVVSGKVLELLGAIQMHRRSQAPNNRYIQSRIFASKRIIEDRFKEEIDPVKLAESVGLGYSNFRKHFREITGFSPVQYVIHLRLRESKEILYNTNHSIKEVAAMAGFKSSYYFVRIFKQKTGFTPRAYRMRTRGIQQSLA